MVECKPTLDPYGCKANIVPLNSCAACNFVGALDKINRENGYRFVPLEDILAILDLRTKKTIKDYGNRILETLVNKSIIEKIDDRLCFRINKSCLIRPSSLSN